MSCGLVGQAFVHTCSIHLHGDEDGDR